MVEERLFGTNEAAKACGVDRRTMLRWAKAGVVKSQQTGGGQRRIRARDLVAFMRTRGIPIRHSVLPHAPRLLMVDDDAAHSRALADVLEHMVPGAEIQAAEDGFYAGMLLGTFRPDIVLLDVQMPGLDGVEVCRRLRADPELDAVAVIVVSAHLDDHVEAQLAALGVQHRLKKPLQPAQLREALAAMLPESRLERA